MHTNDPLSALVRRVDEDRWLAARFAPKSARARLMAIYAVNYEIAKIAEIVHEPQLGALRLAWWRDALGGIEKGRPPDHPAARALAEAPPPLAAFYAIVEARHRDLEAAPFGTWSDVEAYVDATAGGALRLALAACDAPAPDDFVRAAGRAWGLAGLLRATPFGRARGRSPFPTKMTEENAAARMAEFVHSNYTKARAHTLSPAMFPACGYVVLAPRYLRRSSLSLLMRQILLLGASLRGRL